MMSRILPTGTALAIGLSLSVTPARADASDDIEACSISASKADWNAVQFYCTRAIESGELSDPLAAFAFALRCRADNGLQQPALAIEHCSHAIEILPGNKSAYLNLGIAYLARNEPALAITAFDTLLARYPEAPEGYFHRGLAYHAAGEDARAIEDFDRALAIDPELTGAYEYRGQAHFILGNFAAASGDFAVLVERDPTNGYAVLLRSIAGARSGDNVVRVFEADAARVDLATWPGPIVQYFLGDLSKDDLRQAAEAQAGDINTICEYDLYVGLGAVLFDNNFAAARPMFQQAELDCQPNSMADRFAKAELARMPQ